MTKRGSSSTALSRRAHRGRDRGMTLLMAFAVVLGAAAIPALTPSALALGAGQTVDLRVLLIGGVGGAATDPTTGAWAAGLTSQGVAYKEVDAAGTIGSETVTLGSLTSSATHGLYNGVVFAGKPADFAAGQLSALFTYESTFGVRQIDGNAFPTASLGLNFIADADSGAAISSTTGTLTTAGLATFPALAGPVPFDAGSFSSPGTLASPLPTGATETPLLNDAAGNVIVGVFQHPTAAQAPTDPQAGIAELTIGVNYNLNQTQWLLLGPGLIDWVTGGTHLGLYRNYATIHIDDVFTPDDAWSTTTHANNFDPAAALRMTPTDVTTAATWSHNNNFRLDLLFNWAGTDAAQADTGPDPLLKAFQTTDPATGKPYSSDFGWLNHTYDHAYLDVGCATNNYIQAELKENTTKAAAAPGTGANMGTGGLGLTSTSDPTLALGAQDPKAFVPGGHSGLANLIPGAAGAVDPPDIDADAASAGGHLGAGTYTYALTDQFKAGDTTAADESSASVTSPITVTANQKVTLTWNAVCHAGNYRIYRLKSGTGNQWRLIAQVAQPATATPATTVTKDPTSAPGDTDVTGGGMQPQTFNDLGTGTDGTNQGTTFVPNTVEHALELPWEQNPNFTAALSTVGITAVGADASKPYPNPADNQFGIGVTAPTTVFPAAAAFPISNTAGAAQAVPRHPVNIFYNNSTQAQAVDEYNTLYVDTAHGGHCVNSSTTTCLTAPATFAQIVTSVVAGMFANVVKNDPRPTYVHQTNIMDTKTGTVQGIGDGLLYSVLDPLLAQYHADYKSTAPIQQPTLGASATILGEQSGWATAQPPGTASTANTVSASQTGGTVTIKNNGTTPVTVPVTVPTGSTVGATAFGAAYGGTLSAWQTLAAGATLTITVPTPITATQISGTVTDAVTAAPIANVCAYLYVHGGARTADPGVCTDATGKYSLPVAAAGSYDVGFIDSNGAHPTTWSGNAATQAAATAVPVVVGQTSTLNVVMPEITAITGTVTDSVTAAPIANVCVYLYAHGGARTADPGVCTDATGHYQLPVAAAGSYDVAFIDGNGTHFTTWSGNVTVQSTATAVPVTLNHLTTENVAMGEITAITGTVTDSVTAAPIANVCVYLYAHGGARTADPGVCTGSSGTYVLPVAATGSYDVAFLDTSGAHATQWSSGQDFQAQATAVTVTANHLSAGTNAAMRAFGAISGTVTGTGNTATCVYADYASGPKALLYTGVGSCTNASGVYTLPNLLAGLTYKIGFYPPGKASPTNNWYNGAASEATATAVAVSAGQTTTGINNANH